MAFVRDNVRLLEFLFFAIKIRRRDIWKCFDDIAANSVALQFICFVYKPFRKMLYIELYIPSPTQ